METYHQETWTYRHDGFKSLAMKYTINLQKCLSYQILNKKQTFRGTISRVGGRGWVDGESRGWWEWVGVGALFDNAQE